MSRGENLNSTDDRERRVARLQAILDFAKNHIYTNQFDLIEYLKGLGLAVNQPTVSKDIAALNLVPYIGEDGQRHLGRRSEVIKRLLPERYVKAFVECVVNVDVRDYWVVVETIPNTAQTVATVIDGNAWPEVMATTYGLKHVLVMTRDAEAAVVIRTRIEEGLA